MLVLTRRQNEKVLFPTLGISVEVIKAGANKARLGISAPDHVPVLRHELADRDSLALAPKGSVSQKQFESLAQAVRHQLDRAACALEDLNAQREKSIADRSGEIVKQLYGELEVLEKQANSLVEWSDAAKSTHILVVEDSVVERKLMTGLLELNGMTVTAAGDGLEALEFLSLHAPPDAVLLDMMMPRCDGPEFVKQVRSRPQYEELKILRHERR